MQLPIAVRAPFDLAQSLAFLRRFPPCRHNVVLADDRVTAALAVGSQAVRFTVGAVGGAVVVNVDDDLAPATVALVVERARQWLSVDDDLGRVLRRRRRRSPSSRPWSRCCTACTTSAS